MVPYYQDKWGTIYYGDCRDIIPQLFVAGEQFDLVVLDPPYDRWHEHVATMNMITPLSKNYTNWLLFTKQPFDIKEHIKDRLIHEFVWAFQNGGAWISNHRPLLSFQKIYWCSKSNSSYFNPRTGFNYSPRTKPMARGTKVFGGYKEKGERFVPDEEGTWLRDCLFIDKPTNGNIAEKPELLIQTLVQCFSPMGSWVFDPFMGVGTTCFCAKKLSRHYIGIDESEQACEIAARRCSQEVMEL